jgi:hypothetical protein
LLAGCGAGSTEDPQVGSTHSETRTHSVAATLAAFQEQGIELIEVTTFDNGAQGVFVPAIDTGDTSQFRVMILADAAAVAGQKKGFELASQDENAPAANQIFLAQDNVAVTYERESTPDRLPSVKAALAELAQGD